jgi:hypothetical protein
MPSFDELSPMRIYPSMRKYLPAVDEYLPCYSEDYNPPSRFMWNVLNTLDNELVQVFVDHAKKLRQDDRQEID